MHGFVAVPLAGLLGLAGGVLAQIDGVDSSLDPYTSLGAVGLVLVGYTALIRAVIRGEIGHLRGGEREDALIDTLKDVSRALDESTKQIEKGLERERLVQTLLIEHRRDPRNG